MNHKILIVDDEREIVELIKFYLEKENYLVYTSYDGIQALEIINKNSDIELAIVDIMMPKLDGYELIKKIRKDKNIPIIINSAKSEGYEKVMGLDIGADDYITKPFDPFELIARVKSQLRRYYELNNIKNDFEDKKKNIEIGNLILDKDSCEIIKDKESISIGATEYKLIELFMENPDKVFTKDKIFNYVWGDEFIRDDNTIMVHISKLRDKIGNDSLTPPYIKTIRGLGYILKTDDKN